MSKILQNGTWTTTEGEILSWEAVCQELKKVSQLSEYSCFQWKINEGSEEEPKLEKDYIVYKNEDDYYSVKSIRERVYTPMWETECSMETNTSYGYYQYVSFSNLASSVGLTGEKTCKGEEGTCVNEPNTTTASIFNWQAAVQDAIVGQQRLFDVDNVITDALTINGEVEENTCSPFIVNSQWKRDLPNLLTTCDDETAEVKCYTPFVGYDGDMRTINAPISWSATLENIIDATKLFFGNIVLTDCTISMPSVENLCGSFEGCCLLETLDLTLGSAIENTSDMLKGCKSLKILSVSDSGSHIYEIDCLESLCQITGNFSGQSMFYIKSNNKALKNIDITTEKTDLTGELFCTGFKNSGVSITITGNSVESSGSNFIENKCKFDSVTINCAKLAVGSKSNSINGIDTEKLYLSVSDKSKIDSSTLPKSISELTIKFSTDTDSEQISMTSPFSGLNWLTSVEVAVDGKESDNDYIIISSEDGILEDKGSLQTCTISNIIFNTNTFDKFFKDDQSLMSCSITFKNVTKSTNYIVIDEMFSGCTNLTNIFLSDETDCEICLKDISSLGGLYKNCSSLTSFPEVQLADRPNQHVIFMPSVFQGCVGLTEIPSWTLCPTTNNNGWSVEKTCTFYGCTGLTKGKFNAADVSIKGIFNGCSNIETICYEGLCSKSTVFRAEQSWQYPLEVDNSSWPNDDDASSFEDCTSLTEISGLTEIKIGVNGTAGKRTFGIGKLFKNCSKLKSFPKISLSSTSDKIIRANQAYYNCSLLSSIDSIYTGLENACQMFINCTSLTVIPNGRVSNTSNGTQMFSGCTSLTSCSSTFYNLTEAEGMFKGCTSLYSIVSGFRNIKNAKDMFSGCTSLVTSPVIVPTVSTEVSTTAMYQGCSKLTIWGITSAYFVISESACDMFDGCILNPASVVNLKNRLKAFSSSSSTFDILNYETIKNGFDQFRAGDIIEYYSNNMRRYRAIFNLWNEDKTNYNKGMLYLNHKWLLKQNYSPIVNDIIIGESAVYTKEKSVYFWKYTPQVNDTIVKEDVICTYNGEKWLNGGEEYEPVSGDTITKEDISYTYDGEKWSDDYVPVSGDIIVNEYISYIYDGEKWFEEYTPQNGDSIREEVIVYDGELASWKYVTQSNDKIGVLRKGDFYEYTSDYEMTNGQVVSFNNKNLVYYTDGSTYDFYDTQAISVLEGQGIVIDSSTYEIVSYKKTSFVAKMIETYTPVSGDTIVKGSITYTYDGEKWSNDYAPVSGDEIKKGDDTYVYNGSDWHQHETFNTKQVISFGDVEYIFLNGKFFTDLTSEHRYGLYPSEIFYLNEIENLSVGDIIKIDYEPVSDDTITKTYTYDGEKWLNNEEEYIPVSGDTIVKEDITYTYDGTKWSEEYIPMENDVITKTYTYNGEKWLNGEDEYKPVSGDTIVKNGITYTYDGEKWTRDYKVSNVGISNFETKEGDVFATQQSLYKDNKKYVFDSGLLTASETKEIIVKKFGAGVNYGIPFYFSVYNNDGNATSKAVRLSINGDCSNYKWCTKNSNGKWGYFNGNDWTECNEILRDGTIAQVSKENSCGTSYKSYTTSGILAKCITTDPIYDNLIELENTLNADTQQYITKENCFALDNNSSGSAEHYTIYTIQPPRDKEYVMDTDTRTEMSCGFYMEMHCGILYGQKGDYVFEVMKGSEIYAPADYAAEQTVFESEKLTTSIGLMYTNFELKSHNGNTLTDMTSKILKYDVYSHSRNSKYFEIGDYHSDTDKRYLPNGVSENIITIGIGCKSNKTTYNATLFKTYFGEITWTDDDTPETETVDDRVFIKCANQYTFKAGWNVQLQLNG